MSLDDLFTFVHNFAADNDISVEHAGGFLEIGKSGLQWGYVGLSYIVERKVVIGQSEHGYTEQRLLQLAHEIGHIIRGTITGSGGGAEYVRKFSEQQMQFLLKAEHEAWEAARKLLKEAGYDNWPLLDALEERGIMYYKKVWTGEKVSGRQ